MSDQEIMDSDLNRSRRARACRKRSTTVVFQRIHKGLYISHEHDMTLGHEPMWSRDVGRKWELTFRLSYIGSADADPPTRTVSWSGEWNATLLMATSHSRATTRPGALWSGCPASYRTRRAVRSTLDRRLAR